MKIIENHLRNAVSLLSQYDGKRALAAWLKHYFKLHKKYGSKDRKSLGELCYCYFRIGHAFPEMATEERMLLGLFLCNDEPQVFLQHSRPRWNEQIGIPIIEKLSFLGHSLSDLSGLFPFHEPLSKGQDHNTWCQSFLQQPDLFIRIRPGHEDSVKQQLHEAGVVFKEIGSSCLSLRNASKVDGVLDLNRQAVIQDFNSQRAGDFFSGAGPVVWDCCAGSGGKSIMAVDLLGKLDLTVSDIRPSSLANLKKRFEAARIRKYQSFVSDLSAEDGRLPTKDFDLIIADVPCSGSGTWARTPERLFFYIEQETGNYHSLQKQIMSRVSTRLKKGGMLIYITCSVFEQENEEMVTFIHQQCRLELERAELLMGSEHKADSIFVARFRA